MENKIYVNGKSVIIPQCLINKKKGKVSSEIQMAPENLCVPVVISGCKGYIINNTHINELKKLFGRSLYNIYFLNGTYIYKKKDYPTKILPAYKHKFNYVFMTKDSLVDVNSKHLTFCKLTALRFLSRDHDYRKSHFTFWHGYYPRFCAIKCH